MAAARLDPDKLVVTSFATSTQPAGPVATQSAEAACNSPFCGPTFWETCEPGTA